MTSNRFIKGESDWHIPLNENFDEIDSVLYIGAGPHNSIYRGKYLGDKVTDEQYAAISSGTFDDLYIGDYWTIGGINYRIAAFDYYLNTGNDVELTSHHIVLVPDTIMYSAAMNTTSITTTGYANSAMRTTNLDNAKSTIKAAFPNHVLNHQQTFVNAANASGLATGWGWYDSEVELMSETLVYGSTAFSYSAHAASTSVAGGGGYNTGFNKSQLPLFFYRQDMINIREHYWLTDVVSNTSFALVFQTGPARFGTASDVVGVRPVFSIVA